SGANLDHRTAPLSPDKLWRIVTDPSAQPTARVGAAVVLRAGEGESAAEGLSQAAASSANPKLRIAVERVARGAAQEELAVALAELEDDAPQAVRARPRPP